jgi:hypothetical protein
VEAFNSPTDEWCEHCTKKSCAIFGRPDRQKVCGPYKCVWLAEDTLPESLRPDRCKVVLEAVDNRNFLAFVDPEYPNAWREGEVADIITSKLQTGHAVVVVVAGQKNVILPNKERTVEQVWKELIRNLRYVRG